MERTALCKSDKTINSSIQLLQIERRKSILIFYNIIILQFLLQDVHDHVWYIFEM